MSRVCYTPATTGTALTDREDYALAKYEAMSDEERAGIDAWIDALHARYVTRHYKPEPSLRFKLDLLLTLGTFLNEKGL